MNWREWFEELTAIGDTSCRTWAILCDPNSVERDPKTNQIIRARSANMAADSDGGALITLTGIHS